MAVSLMKWLVTTNRISVSVVMKCCDGMINLEEAIRWLQIQELDGTKSINQSVKFGIKAT